MRTIRMSHLPTNRPNARNQAKPVRKENEEENAAEEPERLFDQLVTEYLAEKIIHGLDHPFSEVLQSSGNRFNAAAYELGKNYNTKSNKDRYHHGIRYHYWPELEHLDCVSRKSVMLAAVLRLRRMFSVTRHLVSCRGDSLTRLFGG